MRSKDALLAVLAAMLLVSASFAAYEYSQLTAIESAAGARSAAETVYNLPGVAIEVSCCPKISSALIVGDYYFAASEVSPVPSRTVNGTVYPPADGVMLSLEVHELSSPGNVQDAGFAWYGSFNGSAPLPAHRVLFGGGVVLDWYTLAGLLYMHVETAPTGG